jgi:hypothetical protein
VIPAEIALFSEQVNFFVAPHFNALWRISSPLSSPSVDGVLTLLNSFSPLFSSHCGNLISPVSEIWGYEGSHCEECQILGYDTTYFVADLSEKYAASILRFQKQASSSQINVYFSYYMLKENTVLHSVCKLLETRWRHVLEDGAVLSGDYFASRRFRNSGFSYSWSLNKHRNRNVLLFEDERFIFHITTDTGWFSQGRSTIPNYGTSNKWQIGSKHGEHVDVEVIWLWLQVKLLSICLDTQAELVPNLITLRSYALYVESLTEKSCTNQRVRHWICFTEFHFQR